MVSITEFEKALQSLKEAIAAVESQANLKTKNLLRDGAIQRFEYCVELAWKISIKLLGLTSTAPKPAVREMAQAGLITDVQAWFDFIEARNKGSHSYDENVALEVLASAKQFIGPADQLLQQLKLK